MPENIEVREDVVNELLFNEQQNDDADVPQEIVFPPDCPLTETQLYIFKFNIKPIKLSEGNSRVEKIEKFISALNMMEKIYDRYE